MKRIQHQTHSRGFYSSNPAVRGPVAAPQGSPRFACGLPILAAMGSMLPMPQDLGCTGSESSWSASTSSLSILQMMQLRLREVMSLAQGHTACELKNQELNAGLTPNSMLSDTMLCRTPSPKSENKHHKPLSCTSLLGFLAFKTERHNSTVSKGSGTLQAPPTDTHLPLG